MSVQSDDDFDEWRIPQDRSGRENIHLAEVPEQTFERVDCDSTQNKVEGMFQVGIHPTEQCRSD
jgi:hypothetical protein